MRLSQERFARDFPLILSGRIDFWGGRDSGDETRILRFQPKSNGPAAANDMTDRSLGLGCDELT